MPDKINILFLRDDESFDEILKREFSGTFDNYEIKTAKLWQFSECGVYCRYNYNCSLDSVIILSNDTDKILETINSLPAMSVIQLCESDSFRDVTRWIDTQFFEQFSVNKLNNTDGCLASIIKRNITFLKKFSENHKLLNTVLKIIPDGFTLFDTNGIITHTNARITGYDVAEIVGKSIFNFLDEKVRDKVTELINAVEDGARSARFTTEIYSKSGIMIPVEINATLITDDYGAPLYFLAILTDIRVKKAVWEKEQFLGNVVRASRDGIIVTDREGIINLWNKGDEEIFQYSASEMLGKKISALCSSTEEMEKQADFLHEVREKGYLKGIAVERMRKDGEVIEVEINMTALNDEDGNFNGTMGIIRDISSTKRVLREVQKKNEEMEHLINTVSHDIRSPLHSIDNYLKFISEAIKETVTEEDVYEMLERTHANVSNIESLIQDLTDFSRAGLVSGDEIAVDLNSLLSDIVINIQWQVGKENFVITRDKLPTVRIDPRRFYQAFENLLSNAYKFKRDGEPAKAEIRVKRSGNYLEFMVRDNGIGIGKKHHEKIFNLFYRGKEKIVEGSGAGLAITRRIINSYGGEIWFESESGKGSIFHFTLPVSLMVTE